MKKLQMHPFIKNHLATFKLALRLFAIIGVVYLSMSSCIFTYRAWGDIWNFFRLGHIAPSRIGRSIAAFIGVLVGLATFVQIGPIVWDRLSKWGQDIDNHLAKIVFKKIYFLDKVENLLKQTRKTINKINSTVHQIHWRLSSNDQLERSYKREMQEALENIMVNDLAKADKDYKKIIGLLKANEAYDNLNRERKTKADEDLNVLTIQLTDSCIKVQRLLNQLKPLDVTPKQEAKHAETLS